MMGDSEQLLSRLDFELVRLNLQEVQRQTFIESITQILNIANCKELPHD